MDARPMRPQNRRFRIAWESPVTTTRTVPQRMARTLAHWLTAVAMVIGALAAAPAHAIIYVGDWDPSFGPDFPDLGWRGQATFFVPDACLATDGWVLNGDTCSSNGMQIVNAAVEFYRLSDPTNPAFQETLLFNVPSSAVLSMQLDDGMLTGVLGTFLYSRASTLPIAGSPWADFVLFFEADLARMSYVLALPGGEIQEGISDRHPPDGSPFITFRVVPEPDGLGLLLAALFGAMLLRFAIRRDPRAR